METPFLVRLRAYSAVHFAYDDTLWLTWSDAKALIQSEYTGGEDGRSYAVTLHGEIRGQGESFDAAEARLSAQLSNVLPILALAGNAAIANPLLVTSHGLDLSEPQPFIWYCTPPAADWFPPGRRTIGSALAHSLMTAVGHHPQTDLLHRAIASYREALGHWTPEEQLMAGEFLFIAAETLSRCIVEQRSADRSMTPKNLARLESRASVTALRRAILETEVFGGDGAALAAMESASDGFEHGYMAVEEVRGLMESVLERAMGHVRRSLIDTAGPERASVEQLLAKEYDEPRGLVPALQIIHGRLRRSDSNLPAPEMPSPAVELDWPSSAIEATQTASGDLHIAMPSDITVAQLPENTTLEIEGIGLRAANVGHLGTSEVDVTQSRDEDSPTAPETS